jgi:hypothetical protein
LRTNKADNLGKVIAQPETPMPSMPIRSHVPKTTLSNHPCKSAALGVFATALLAASGAYADTPTYCVSNDSDLVSALSLAQAARSSQRPDSPASVVLVLQQPGGVRHVSLEK